MSLESDFKLTVSDHNVSDHTFSLFGNHLKKVIICVCVSNTKSLGYIAILKRRSPRGSNEKFHQQSPPLEKQTKCARLKAMASESLC